PQRRSINPLLATKRGKRAVQRAHSFKIPPPNASANNALAHVGASNGASLFVESPVFCDIYQIRGTYLDARPKGRTVAGSFARGILWGKSNSGRFWPKKQHKKKTRKN